VVGATSLYEVDKLIQGRRERTEKDATDQADEQLVDERLPKQYREFKDVFSKKDADTLPPPREGVDHKIELEGEGALPTTSSLYHMSLEQLEMVKG
jgi:hypothetical protein